MNDLPSCTAKLQPCQHMGVINAMQDVVPSSSNGTALVRYTKEPGSISGLAIFPQLVVRCPGSEMHIHCCIHSLLQKCYPGNFARMHN